MMPPIKDIEGKVMKRGDISLAETRSFVKDSIGNLIPFASRQRMEQVEVEYKKLEQKVNKAGAL